MAPSWPIDPTTLQDGIRVDVTHERNPMPKDQNGGADASGAGSAGDGGG